MISVKNDKTGLSIYLFIYLFICLFIYLKQYFAQIDICVRIKTLLKCVNSHINKLSRFKDVIHQTKWPKAFLGHRVLHICE